MILALRALGLGDLLTAVPALRALARCRSGREPLALATPVALGALARLAAPVDLVVPTPSLGPLPPQAHGASLAVNLHGRGPESTAWLRATRPGRLVAFDIDGCPEWEPNEHDRVRWCRLLVESGLVGGANPDDCRVEAPDWVRRPWLDHAGTTVIHPGAAARARRWPPSRWCAVARSEVDRGRRVVVTGSAIERPLAQEIAAAAGLPSAAVLAGATDVVGLVGLIAVAGLVMCGDTGVAHVASAVGTPSVVLFGPVSPARWGPPASGPHVALWAGTTGDPHAERTDDGLLAISVADVAAALDHLESALKEEAIP